MHSFPAIPSLKAEILAELSRCWKLFFTKWLNYDMLCQYVPQGRARLLSFGTTPHFTRGICPPITQRQGKIKERWNPP